MQTDMAPGSDRSLARLIHMPPAWRGPMLRLALAVLAILIVSWHDWLDMADQWWNSSTYNHILLVPAVLAWLVWQRRDALILLVPQAWWPGLLVIAGALFLWLLGSLSGLNLARQLGAVVALQGAVAALLGPRVFAALLFPVCYMIVLVPFGDELVPALQMITAKITIGLTHLSGIPAEIEGVFINTPVGLFEVAEACSGVKFLIAMVALGALAAHICFERWGKRIAYMAAAVAIPILANGVRAWGTIYIAQFAGVEFAAGFDHIFYGWVFFALVMAVLLAIAWKYYDRDAEAPFVDVARLARSPWLARLAAWQGRSWTVLLGSVLLCAATIGWDAASGSLSARMPARIDLPQVSGWTQVDYAPAVWWEPRAGGADHRLLGSYADGQGHRVDVFFALYAAQEEGREAGGFGEGALMPDGTWRWLEYGPAIAGAKSDRLLADGHSARLAATFYRTGGLLTGSNTRLKLATMRDRMLMRERPTMLLILSAEEGVDAPAAASIAAFRQAAGPLGEWMDRLAKAD